MKKRFTICIILLLFTYFLSAESSPLIAIEQKKTFDCDLKFYLIPSLFGIVTGNNPYLGLRKNPEEVGKCFNFIVEGKGLIYSTEKYTISWSVGFNSYDEFKEDVTSVAISLGVDGFFHVLKKTEYPLTGLCLYLYPAYNIPLYARNCKPYLKCFSAVDVGYNFTIFGSALSLYPYIRTIVGWNSHDSRYGIDCGLSVGYYIRQPYK